MLGENELRLNHSSVCEAIEYWLNTVVLRDDKSVVVGNVNQDTSKGTDAYSTFCVRVNPKV